MSSKRVLAISEHSMDGSAIPSYLEGIARQKAICEAQGIHFWVFRSGVDPNRFIEFVETKDELLLDRAGLDIPLSQRWYPVEGA